MSKLLSKGKYNMSIQPYHRTTMNTWDITLKHDVGTSTIEVSASTLAKAIDQLLSTELCHLRAIVKTKHVRTIAGHEGAIC